MTTQDNLVLSTPSPTEGLPAFRDWSRRMRDEHPVHFDEARNAWQLFRYDDVMRAHQDHNVFSSRLDKVMPEIGDLGRGSIVIMDPPQHRKVRTLVSQAFTPRTVRGLAPRITEITEELLSAVVDRDRFDLVSDLTYPLPVTVISELLGLPVEDREFFRRSIDARLSRDFVRVEDALTDEELIASMEEANSYMLDHVRVLRRQPGEGLISKLITAEVDGEKLDDVEIVNFANLLFAAGHITTTMLLGNTMLSLDEHPAAAVELRADPDLIPSALEEVLRTRTPVSMTFRATATDVDLHGRTIPANSLVALWLFAANHDERQFGEPDTFDIRRDPNPHLGFGQGIHFCLGAPLARLESKIALEILLRRFPELRVLRDEVEIYPNTRIIGTRRLPVAPR
ncbi:cytochrome P450 [Longimycelium tulufanense]|uniref:Cytochrome P450 n=1 Tax=Longimycelium tulufanense TaxID=907463 RepID=A0A8J3FWF8_9PSEU|nr:cytochrome P450 [Longimycelium tulufanense]GGM71673.1 cytochrome P450 [Longimycelium tulufanense]